MKKFVSLEWYDSLIEFIFRFVTKPGKPFLTAGVVISAADFLSHGQVMAGHPAFRLAWAWCQALALESSSGVVFVYALSAFRTQDKIKGSIYLALALLLAIVGGGMLLLQVNAVTMGSAETAVPILNIMRVVVSILYIFLLRAKSIRFSDLADVHEQPVHVPDVDRIVDIIVERVSARVNVVEEQKQLALAPARVGKFPSKEQEVAAILARSPGASVEQVAQEAGCNVRTAEKWIKRYQEKA